MPTRKMKASALLAKRSQSFLNRRLPHPTILLARARAGSCDMLTCCVMLTCLGYAEPCRTG